jgi:hypothetical protein
MQPRLEGLGGRAEPLPLRPDSHALNEIKPVKGKAPKLASRLAALLPGIALKSEVPAYWGSADHRDKHRQMKNTELSKTCSQPGVPPTFSSVLGPYQSQPRLITCPVP